MRAWVYRPENEDGTGVFIYLDEVEDPTPGESDLLLKIRKVSVCGTDEALFRGNLRRARAGIVPGHEFCGEIVEVGRGAGSFRVGQLVAGESHYQVEGGSEDGIIGLWPPRLHNGSEGRTVDGAYSEYICIPSACAHIIPEALTENGFWPSLFEPAGNDFLLAREVMTEPRPSRVGVFGCGAHGLYAQIFLRHFGLAHLTAYEPDPFRRSFARGLGCADEVLEAPLGDGTEPFDSSLDMVGKDGEAFRQCCRLTRPGGTIFLFGLFNREFQINGQAANDLIFNRRTLELEIGGKRLRIAGVTGREGVWPDLIRTVAASPALQEQLMKPVTIIGSLDRLGEDTRLHRHDVLKRAFSAFE